MKHLEYVLKNEKEVLAFLKTQYPLYHLSNVFFRDVQYGIQKFFERRGESVAYPLAERIAREYVEKLEREKTLTRIDRQTWVLNYPEYKKVAAKTAAPAKPAPGAAPAKSPAATGAPKPSLPPLGSAKPAGAKPGLPPLSGAKPAGAKPALPPLASAKPAAAPAAATPTTVAVADAPPAAPPEPKVEAPKPAGAGSAAAAQTPGPRKPLPPLKGNYTPAGKK